MNANLLIEKKPLRIVNFDYPEYFENDPIEVGRVYKTKNYSMFETLKNNRGVDSGIIPQKVKAFIDLIESNKFLMGTIHVFLNLYGIPYDGNHKLTALMQKGEYINFIVINEDKLNTNNLTELMPEVALINEDSWTVKQTTETAKSIESPVAKAIERIKPIIEKKLNDLGLVWSKVTPTGKRVICPSPLTSKAIFNFVTEYRANVRRLSFYNDNVLAEKINSVQTIENLVFIAQILHKFRDLERGYHGTYFVRDLIKHCSENPQHSLNWEYILKKTDLVAGNPYKFSDTSYGRKMFVMEVFK